MNLLITGGAGFVGQRVALECLKRGQLKIGAGRIERIVLTDVSEPVIRHESLFADERVSTHFGDISDQSFVQSLFQEPKDLVFHLASIVSGHGEQDFDLAMRVNLDGTRHLFEAIRHQDKPARVVFASSLASFGGDTMPDQVDDFSKQTPQTTYGVTKAIGELLINDYSRKGFFDGRSARLPTVYVRPGKPNLAASSFVSGLFREPLNGEDCVIPVDPSLSMPVLGYRNIANSLIRLAELDAENLGTDRAVGLPALNVTVQQMMDALKRVAGNRHVGEHVMQRDEQICTICESWPKYTDSERAVSLGLPVDASVDNVVSEYIEDYLENA
jgi:nucleoside-diphosphate-sugar epimerase